MKAMAAACTLALAAAVPIAGDPGTEVVVPGYYPGDKAMWERIATLRPAMSFEQSLSGIVLPHHMADQDLMAAAWRGVSIALKPSLIVLMCPDHFGTEASWVKVPRDAVFPTPYGQVNIARDLARRLEERGAARRVDPPFLLEHGIFAHTTFLEKFFPAVPVLPIIIKQQTDRAALDALVAALQTLVPKGAFFAASVDFSHYNPVEVSVFHDKSSAKAVLSMDKEELFDQEVDSPESLYVLESLMEIRGASRPVQFLSTQLQSHFSRPLTDNTSHLYFAFYPGKPTPVRAVSLMVFPQSTDGGGRQAFPGGARLGPSPAKGARLAPDSVLESWRWSWLDPERTRRAWPLLSRLSGRTDRFFMGSDLYLFDLEPGQVIEKRVSGLRVVIVTLAAGNPSGRSPARIAELARGSDVLVVVDYDQSAGARGEWEEYARAGARIIIGRGSHAPAQGQGKPEAGAAGDGPAPASWRVRGGVLFVESLGLLDWGNRAPLPSSVLGVYVDGSGCVVQEFPLTTLGGLPAYRAMVDPAGSAAGGRSSLQAPSTVPMERE